MVTTIDLTVDDAVNQITPDTVDLCSSDSECSSDIELVQITVVVAMGIFRVVSTRCFYVLFSTRCFYVLFSRSFWVLSGALFCTFSI